MDFCFSWSIVASHDLIIGFIFDYQKLLMYEGFEVLPTKLHFVVVSFDSCHIKGFYQIFKK